MRRFMFFALIAACLVASDVWQPTDVAAQTELRSRAASLRVGGRLHTQYATSFDDDADSDFFVRRARVLVDATFTDFVSGRVQVDFAGGNGRLQDAYLRLNFEEGFRLSFGQFKRAFDLFELSSSTDLSIVERTGSIIGFNQCDGVGRLCSYSRLTEGLDYAGRDAGVKIDGSSETFSYSATLTNGEGINVGDSNDGKSLSGRGVLLLSDQVQLGGNLSFKDYVGPNDDTDRAIGWAVDVQAGTWRDGLLVQAAIASGDNWRVLDTDFDPATFTAGQVAVSYYVPLDGDRIVGVEPVGRVSIADPDGDTADNGGVLITPGVMFYFLGKNKIGFNYDWYDPSTGDAASTLRIASFLYF